MFASISQGSTEALAILAACFLLILIFEASNGFHDTANAVATHQWLLSQRIERSRS